MENTALSIGVDDYVGRWIANSLTGADGAAVIAWPSAYGSRDLASPGGSASPLLKVVAGDKYVKFDGTDDVLTQSGTSPSWMTTVVLARWDGGSATQSKLAAMAASTGLWFSRNTSGTVKVTGGSNLDLTSTAHCPYRSGR